jgi:hypothetical protein
MVEGVLTEEEALDLLAYLASSAELTLIEPDLYGSFRLLDAASRLLSHLAERTPVPRRDGYRELKDQIDRKKLLMMSDREKYVEFVRELPGGLARELVRTARVPEEDADDGP